LSNKNICFCQGLLRFFGGIKSIALNCILMSIGRLYYYETLKNLSKKAGRVHTHTLLIIWNTIGEVSYQLILLKKKSRLLEGAVDVNEHKTVLERRIPFFPNFFN